MRKGGANPAQCTLHLTTEPKKTEWEEGVGNKRK